MTDNLSHMSSKKLRIAAFIAGTFLAITILLAIEFLSYMVLKIKDNPYPFLFSVPKRIEGVAGGFTRLTYLDPHLGFAHSPTATDDSNSFLGFVVYGDADWKSDKILRIVCLGGSTTDPDDPNNWPKKLHEMLEARGTASVVLNGGVSGYSSNQELIKLIRDVLPLKPDIVISLSGINDVGFCHSVSGHPMVHPYQEAVFRTMSDHKAIIFPSTVHVLQALISKADGKSHRITGMSMGPETSVQPAEQWTQNIRTMHAVAEEFGIKYICFLQPVMGIGEYSMSPEEKEMLKRATDLRGEIYLKQIKEFYQETKKLCSKTEYCVDLTDTMKGKTGMYRDARHQSAEGYEAIAEAISKELEGLNCIDFRGSATARWQTATGKNK